MSLFNYLDEQTNKNNQDKSFMGLGTLWDEMGKPVIDSVDKGLLSDEAMTDANWADQHTAFVDELVENQDESMFKDVGKRIVNQSQLSWYGLKQAGIESGLTKALEHMPRLGLLGSLGINQEKIKEGFNNLIGRETKTEEEELALIKQITDELMADRKTIQPPEGLSLTQKGVLAAVESAPLMAVSMLASFATANPWTGLAMMGTFTAGSSYGSARTEDMPVPESLRYAAIDGTIEMVTERISIVPMMNMFRKGGKESIQNAKKYVVNELIGENVAEFTQEMNAWYHGLSELWQNPNLTITEKLKVQAEQQWIATVAASVLSGSTTATSQVLHKGQEWVDALPEDHPLKEIVASAGVPTGSKMWMGDETSGVGFDVEKYGEIDVARTKAEKMLESGGRTINNLRQIWSETGHFVTPSGQIVWEIDDSPMQFKELDEINELARNSKDKELIGVYKLEDFIDHPELFANYGELKDMDVVIRNGEYSRESGMTGEHGTVNQQTGAGAYGSYNPESNTMMIYVDPRYGLTIKHKEAIVHEIQHGAQEIEGHPPGGDQSMTMMKQLYDLFEEEHKMLTHAFTAPDKTQLRKIFPTPKHEQNAIDRIGKIKSWMDELDVLLKQDQIRLTPGQRQKNIEKRWEIYLRLEGEWMARNTQTRMEYMGGRAHKQGITSPLEELGQPDDSEQGYRMDAWDRQNQFPLFSSDTQDLVYTDADGNLVHTPDPYDSNLIIYPENWQDRILGHKLHAPALEKGLLGDTVVPRLKASDFKRNKDGTYVGFNKSINTPQKITKLLKQLEGLAIEGADARMWYENSSKDIMDLVNGDKVEAEKIAQILAITSQGTDVKSNTGFAFKAYMQHKAGMPIEAGRFPKEQAKKIINVLNGIPWEGRKTNSFYGNLMTQIDPSKVIEGQTTQDMWMARAFGLSRDVPGDAQYKIMEEITQNIAAQNGWTPYQAQAAIWVATKARNESMKSEINAHIKKKKWGTNADTILPQHQQKFNKYFQQMVYDSKFDLKQFTKASYSFADGIQDNLGFINLEAVPSTELVNVLPGIHNAPPEQKAEFTKAMYSIFLDENGVDLLAKEIGIVSPDGFMGFGGWDGDINPNMQVQGILSGTISGGINPADVQLVELYAAVVGTVFKQDGVSYRRAFNDTKVSAQNGVDLDVGRRLTAEEHEKIYDALIKVFGHTMVQPTSTGTGADIIQYRHKDGKFEIDEKGLGFDMPNKEFQKLVEQAIMEVGLEDDIHIGFYRSDGKLVENNWKEQPNGEGYEGNTTTKSQSLYRQLVDKYSQEAETIRQEFADKYGWGQVQKSQITEGLLQTTVKKPPNHLLE